MFVKEGLQTGLQSGPGPGLFNWRLELSVCGLHTTTSPAIQRLLITIMQLEIDEKKLLIVLRSDRTFCLYIDGGYPPTSIFTLIIRIMIN